MKKATIILFFLILKNLFWAQIGRLIPDSTFNYTSTVTRSSFVTNKVIATSNNRILCAGSVTYTNSSGSIVNSDFGISRFLPNGTIDSTFGTNGYLVINNGFTDEAFWHIENFDSGFLVIGYYNNANNNGWFYQAPGGDCFMIKIDQSGNLDLSFGSNGIKYLSLNPKFNIADIKFNSNNDIFLLINQMPYFGYTDKGKIIKFNSHGVMDVNFGTMGTATLPIYLPQSMNILSDKSFVVLAADTSHQLSYGYSNSQPGAWQSSHLCKLDSSGSIDTNFGVNGKKLVSYNNIGFTVRMGSGFGSGFYMYGDEGFISDTNYHRNYLYKFDNSGTLDNTFSGDGRLLVRVFNSADNYNWAIYNKAMKILNNDLYIFGSSEIYSMNCQRKSIIRVNSVGIQDTTIGTYKFSPEPVFDQQLEDSTYHNPFACFEFSQWNDICMQNDGKIIAAGTSFEYDTTITSIPNGNIVSRLIPSSIVTGIKNDGVENLQTNIKLYPNPFHSQTTIQVNHILKDATLTLYNSYGQVVKQIKNISEQTIILNRDNLTSGIYFVKLTRGANIISVNKLVIID